jgi:hypothetical protein
MVPIGHVFGILVRPRAEWETIEREPGSVAGLMLGYVAILALIPALAWLIGVSAIGITVSIGTFKVPITAGLISVAIGYLSTFAIVYVVALVIDALAPTFDSPRNFRQALKLSVYSHTALWIAGVFLVYPRLRFLTYFLGLYGFYLAWTGLPVLFKTPKEKSLLFAIAILVSAVIVTVILGVVVNAVSGISGARRAL